MLNIGLKKRERTSAAILHRIAIILINSFLISTIPSGVEGSAHKTVVFGSIPDIPPYIFNDSLGHPSGYAVDIVVAVTEELGWRSVIKLEDASLLKEHLSSEKIDALILFAFSEEREKNYSFSIPYHESRYSIFINSTDIDRFNSTITRDLQPVTQKLSIVYYFMKSRYPENSIVITGKPIDSLSYISREKNSFTILNKYIGLYLIKQNGIENVTAVGDPVFVERYHFAALKKNSDIIQSLNEGLNLIRINGRYNSIYAKWFTVLDKESSYDKKVVKTIPLILVLILFVYLLFVSWTLKKKIRHQNSMLSVELEKYSESEKALMESEEKSRLIIENAPVGILHFNIDGELTSYNESFIKLTGITREELPVYSLKDFFENKSVNLLESVLNGKPAYYEGVYYSERLKTSTQVRTMFTPVILSDGTITGGIGIIEDNTARKKYEEELLQAKEVAESASDIKTDFLANMSHEVRTPLNGILGMLQLIQTTGVTEEQANYIDVAIKSGMRLTRLLNDILDLSRIETDRLVLTETKFSLNSVINFIQERYEKECEEKGIKLSLTIGDTTPDEIIGDEIRIRQILVNLVSNSVKFTKTGFISVKINAEDISCYGEINIIINVKDTGIGITDSMMSRIFEPFRQGENSYRRAFQGAGLGLTLVRHLVNLMNGNIKIDSTPGIGTSVECVLKVKLPENQQLIPKPLREESHGGDGSTKTVLIAEDERINRLALKRILEKTGFRVLEAENGLKALEILDSETPDCILMDIQMPEMDGIEATRIIRNDARFSKKSGVPIIALTAYTMPEDRSRISSAGIDDYISKPINMEYLIKTLSRYTDNS